jgi:protein-tyrosine phosphatase
MYDIHSHVLPEIDDGARSLADSIELCRRAAAEGTRAIVATPHIREGVWPNRRDRIAERVEDLREELKKAQVDIDLVLGAEVFLCSDIVDGLGEGAFPTYAEARRYFLFELPSHFILRQVQQLVFEFRTRGLTPVIAHPERNPMLMSSLEALEELTRMGALLQLTAASITGRFGRAARRSAATLIERGLAHAVASDGHHPQYRPTGMRQAYALVAERYGATTAELLLVENPRRIIAGEEAEGGVLSLAGPRPRGLRSLLSRLLGS